MPDENEYRKLNFLWLRIKDSCEDLNASACVKKQDKITRNFIDTSDKRDVQLVNATDKIDRVSHPNDPGLFTAFKPHPYEQALFQLVRIQDEVMLVKAVREGEAAEAIDKARNNLPLIDGRIAAGQQILVPHNLPLGIMSYVVPAQIALARQQADAADTIVAEVSDELSEALRLDAMNQTHNVEQIRIALRDRRVQIDSIHNAKAYCTPNCSVN